MRYIYAISGALIFLFFLLTGQHIPSNSSSHSSVWADVDEPEHAALGDRHIIPNTYRMVKANLSALEEKLSIALAGQAVELELPHPDGSFQKYRVEESPVMEEGLASRYPEIRTFRGIGIDDRTATARFDITPKGFHAMVISVKGTFYLDPYATQTNEYYISYTKKAFSTDKVRNEMLPVDAEFDRLPEMNSSRGANTPNGSILKTYRAAIACTGEYASFHGGTVPAALAAIVTSLNRVNTIYEREVAVTMVLVDSNDQIIFLDGSTDPYSNNNAGDMLGENQSTLTSIIGQANYDIGHVFSTGAGGVASLGSVCRSGRKARGVTGISTPIGDPFDVDYVAHEIGHQFGGAHTFNGTSGSCGGNRSGNSAYEPGSATTIMGYAGICGGDNIAFNSDDYFHTHSYTQIVEFITNGMGSTCGTDTISGNNPPGGAIRSPVGVTIPIETPFEVVGIAGDIDGDLLTYCWEEYDLGPAGAPRNPSGNAPIFRSFPPTLSPERVFPQITDIVNGTQTFGEILPTYTRTLDFRFTVRDNHPGSGGVDFFPYRVNVSDVAGPFLVMNPNDAGIAWDIDSLVDVTWDVAGTDLLPIFCTEVDVYLSVDGGFTYPFLIAEDLPNTGSAQILVPPIPSTTARVKIKGSDNIFFDISDNNFTIEDKNVSIDPLAEATHIVLLQNPVEEMLLLDVTAPVSGKGNLVIYDLKGSQISTVSVLLQANEAVRVQTPISVLAPGMYFYSLGTDSFRKSGKFIKR